MTDVIRFESLEVEALAEIANEAAGQVESFARKAVEQADRCGRALMAIKEKLPHGEWGKWLGRNFDYSQEHARRYMTIAANSTRVWNLKDATSIREALRMIADPIESEQMLDEASAAYGESEGINVIVEPSRTPGYAYLSILNGNDCVWLKRPIQRNHIPRLIRAEIPANARLSWVFTENANRVDRAMFSDMAVQS